MNAADSQARIPSAYEQEVQDLLSEVSESLLRLYSHQKYLFGTEDRYGCLDEILNIHYRVNWAQEKLALRHEVLTSVPTTVPDGSFRRPCQDSCGGRPQQFTRYDYDEVIKHAQKSIEDTEKMLQEMKEKVRRLS